MRKIFYLLFCVIYFQSLNAQILINEYSAANYDSYQDNYGEYEDWVEIYNSTVNPIDINGWYLSDKINNPLKWQIPGSLTVPGLGGVLIYCSGRDEVTGGYAHSNFKLTQTKGNEVLMLSDASGTLQDSIRVFPNPANDHKGDKGNYLYSHYSAFALCDFCKTWITIRSTCIPSMWKG